MPRNMPIEPKVLTTFKQLAEMPNLAVLAVSTTDFKGVPVEVAIVDAEENPVYNFRCQIAPGYVMQPGAAAFHGISAEELAGALPAPGILKEARRVALGAYHTPAPFLVAYDPGFIADTIKRAFKAYGEAGEIAPEYFAELAADERRDVKELYSFISGTPSQKTGAGPHKTPFAWVGLAAALKERGVAADDLDASAIGQARRVVRLIKAVAALTPEDLPHLLEACDAEPPAFQSAAQDLKQYELDRLTFENPGQE